MSRTGGVCGGALLLVLAFAGCANRQRAPFIAPAASKEVNEPVAVSTDWRQHCAQQDGVDVLHHDVELSIVLGAKPSITGRAELRLRARRATSVAVLDARELSVSAVSYKGQALRFQNVDNQLCVELPNSFETGAELSVALTWGTATGNNVPKVFPDQVWAGYGARAWMPTRQDPAQRATLALRIRAAPELKVIASGQQIARDPDDADKDGFVTHAFELRRPSPPFLYAFAVGEFAEAERKLDGVVLRALGPKSADLASALTITEPMYRLLVELTGVPLPASEYTQVFVHGDAAQEAAGIALLAESSLTDVRADPTEDWIFSHELAHQWFGWLVPCADFADFWLNEGFATFFVALAKERRWGRAAYEKEVALWRERSAKVHAEGRDAPLSLSSPALPLTSAPKESELQARGITYSRGALVLHKLRTELGEDHFRAGIRRYIKDRAGKGARTEDLRQAFEAVSGRDLKAFFSRWVYAPAFDL